MDKKHVYEILYKLENTPVWTGICVATSIAEALEKFLDNWNDRYENNNITDPPNKVEYLQIRKLCSTNNLIQ